MAAAGSRPRRRFVRRAASALGLLGAALPGACARSVSHTPTPTPAVAVNAALTVNPAAAVHPAATVDPAAAFDPAAAVNAAGAVDTSLADEAFERLRAWENETRAKVDFARAPPSGARLGTDPYVVRALPGSGRARYVGLLRGRDALVVLDAGMQEIERLPAPASASGLAVGAGGDVFAVGELAGRVARYRPTARGIEAAGSIELADVRAMRDVEAGPEGVVYVVEEHDGRLVTVRPGPLGDARPAKRVDERIGHGPLRLLRTARWLLIDCLLDHTIVARSVDGDGFPAPGDLRITRDGPLWGMDALDDDGALTVAVGAVEDHALDRTQGSFGFIDSFVTLYTMARGGWVESADVNVSALGVVTPKALRLGRTGLGGRRLAVAGYATDRLLTLEWADPRAAAPPSVRAVVVPPGSAMMALSDDGYAIANPLVDAWVRVGPERVDVVHVDDASRSRPADSRLGEALFFTTLMAPWNRSDGRLSRFTCEACHFEGYVDGRTHATGRGDVRATTKPLVGLFNNRPHFSRALDPDLATMVDNEFGVAGAKSDHDPWFSLRAADFPWLREIGVGPDETLGPERLRRALMTFLMEFPHRPNPSVVGRTHWTDAERAGATVFARRCESCHQARLVADDPSTRVAFDRWERLVMAPEGAVVWASSDYARTGVMPYVSDKGARVVSLRRLYKKYPYFTNGSAKDIESVLAGAAFTDDGRFYHQGAPPAARHLPEDERGPLAAFLDLL